MMQNTACNAGSEALEASNEVLELSKGTNYDFITVRTFSL